MQQIAILRSRLDIEASARQAEKMRLLQVLLTLRVAPPHRQDSIGCLAICNACLKTHQADLLQHMHMMVCCIYQPSRWCRYPDLHSTVLQENMLLVKEVNVMQQQVMSTKRSDIVHLSQKTVAI